MAKILMVFGSSTGNTENIAHLIAKKIAAKGHQLTIINAAEAKPDHLALDYDAVLMGCSAWGEEEVELQDDFATFFEDIDKMDLKDKKVAAFASGERSYPHFCGAVDVIVEKAKELGATIIADGLKLEGDGSADDAEITSFANDVLKAL